MHPILRNILAVLAGLIAGNIVNMGLIELGSIAFPLEGADPNNMEAFAAAMVNANALGTLIGAILAAKLGVKYKITLAFVIGFFFLAGGIMVNYLIPGPTWFAALDLAVAYLPMAWIGGKIGSRLKK
jgi:hypothetical protein